MRSIWLVTSCIALLLLVPTAVAEDEDLTITLTKDESPLYEGPAGLVELVNASPGERLEWRLNLTEDYTVAEIRLGDAFDVERPKQVVPLLDGKHFVEVRTFDVTEVDAPAKVLRLVETANGSAYRLGIPGPTNGTLTLHADTAPPAFSLGPIEQLTHVSFHVETRTTEAAYGDLLTRAADSDEEWVQHPTPSPAILQKFPIQGLEAGTRYEYRFVFEDWSGNVAESDILYVETLAEPERPLPIVTIVSPAYNATLPPTGVTVAAVIESPQSPVTQEGVRLFFDKREIRDNFSVMNGELIYEPGALLPGIHTFSVEVTNVAGGKAHAVGRFHVQVAEAPGLPLVTAFAALGAAASTLRAHRDE